MMTRTDLEILADEPTLLWREPLVAEIPGVGVRFVCRLCLRRHLPPEDLGDQPASRGEWLIHMGGCHREAIDATRP
jgi:hypothetical protein